MHLLVKNVHNEKNNFWTKSFQVLTLLYFLQKNCKRRLNSLKSRKQFGRTHIHKTTSNPMQKPLSLSHKHTQVDIPTSTLSLSHTHPNICTQTYLHHTHKHRYTYFNLTSLTHIHRHTYINPLSLSHTLTYIDIPTSNKPLSHSYRHTYNNPLSLSLSLTS